MTLTTGRIRLIVISAIVLAAVALGVERGEAHKAITTKYTYNDDVFPIFRDRCASCHVTGGVAPMSLMTYDDATPWAESIRAELVAAHMPPWNAEDGFGEFKHPHTLSPRELDVILDWATGGNPRGALDQKLPPVELKNDWALGPPDLALPMPAFAFAADKMEDTLDVTLATRTADARWVRAVDLLPGTPSIVRSAVIYVKAPAAAASASPAPERVLARWVPGHDPEPMDGGAALRLPAGAELVARIHYKKTWQFEGKPMTDRSTVGVYFASQQTAQELLTLPITGSLADPRIGKLTFEHVIQDDVQALALSPDEVPPNITLQVEAVLPDGSRARIIQLNTRADWDRRYWFERPLTLPRGTRIEVSGNLDDPDILSGAFGATTAPRSAASLSTVRLALNVVPARAKPSAP
jgi:mono/diheme cytochrome c family protein